MQPAGYRYSWAGQTDFWAPAHYSWWWEGGAAITSQAPTTPERDPTTTSWLLKIRVTQAASILYVSGSWTSHKPRVCHQCHCLNSLEIFRIFFFLLCTSNTRFLHQTAASEWMHDRYLDTQGTKKQSSLQTCSGEARHFPPHHGQGNKLRFLWPQNNSLNTEL